jgi:threonine synthase
MKFASTAGGSPSLDLGGDPRGAAPDGGLYVPAGEVNSIRPAGDEGGLAPLGAHCSRPSSKAIRSRDALPALVRGSVRFPGALVVPDAADPGFRILELFHGPTGAFKDFGARFLMACFDRLGVGDDRLTVLAATSGDTGGAVGCAAKGTANPSAPSSCFPRGRVSPFQQHQLGCWGEPVTALEVDGDFDSCQRLVKAAFADPALARAHRLTSANSINIGRLLPQMVFIAATALRVHRETGVAPGFLIPTGNLGHAVAALWARGLGLPVGPVVAVTNANRPLPTGIAAVPTGRCRPVATLANAMDIGAPNNFERLGEGRRPLPADGGRARRRRGDPRADTDRACAQRHHPLSSFGDRGRGLSAARPGGQGRAHLGRRGDRASVQVR